MHEKDYSVDQLAHETEFSRSTINRARGELIVTCRLITLVKEEKLESQKLELTTSEAHFLQLLIF